MSLFRSLFGKKSEEPKKEIVTDKWQVGDRIANQYEIYHIKTGGMGIVYICYDHKNKTPYVLKTFQDKYLFSEEPRKLFEREALIWIELERYPYIVHAYWVDRLESKLFIILEYIAPDNQGRNTLTHYLGNLSYSEILKFGIQFCFGLEYAYSKGIKVHRDIKPDNIMITHDKTVKITDFGLAKAFDELQIKGTGFGGEFEDLGVYKTKGGKVAGTLPYMAPEQFDGYADKRSDVYSFGIVLYQMANNGKLPFIGSSFEEFEGSHKLGRIPPISSSLFTLIEKAMEKRPEARYQDFGTIRKELEPLLQKETGEIFSPPDHITLKAAELSTKGFALGNLGRYEEEIKCCDEAIWIDPRYNNAWYNKGVALGNLGRYEEAIKCYDKAIGINLKDAEAWGNKCNALLNLGRYEESIECCNKAIQINPGDEKDWSNKGSVLVNLGRYKEAVDCYNKAIQINPRLAETWHNKGVALGKLERFEEQIRCFDEAIRINPGIAGPWFGKGGALLFLSRPEEAIKCLDEAIRINPKDANYMCLKGFALYHLKRDKEALTYAEESLKIDPNIAAARKLKQLCLEAMKE